MMIGEHFLQKSHHVPRIYYDVIYHPFPINSQYLNTFHHHLYIWDQLIIATIMFNCISSIKNKRSMLRIQSTMVHEQRVVRLWRE